MKRVIAPAPPPRVAHPHVVAKALPYAKQESYLIDGRRFPVSAVWELVLRVGMSVEEILSRYPAVPPAFMLSALAFAYDNMDIVNAELATQQGDDGTPWNLGTGPSTYRRQQVLPFPDPPKPPRARPARPSIAKTSSTPTKRSAAR